MRKIRKSITLIAVVTLAILLVGCSKEDSESLKMQEYEYTHIDAIFRNLCKEEMPIGDWSFGTGNENAHGKNFNKDCPIFTIYVNPFATDEVIDLYVENLLIIDRHMAANKPYMKYIRKEAPYTVSFECLSKELFRVDIDGKVDRDKVINQMKESLEGPCEDARVQIDEFNRFLESDKDILRGPNNDLYFLLDSKNLSDSLDEVIPMVEKIHAAYPFLEEEVTGWYGSSEYLGIPGGYYQFYFDEYGNDPLFSGDYFNFAIEPRIVCNSAYSHFVPTGTYSDEKAEAYYYCMDYGDGDVRAFGGYEAIHTEDGYVSEEAVCDVLYELYDRIMTAHEEHGIRPMTDLELGGDGLTGKTDETNDAIGLETDAVIPMDARISREEFDAIILAGTQTYRLSDRELSDDCIE